MKIWIYCNHQIPAVMALTNTQKRYGLAYATKRANDSLWPFMDSFPHEDPG